MAERSETRVARFRKFKRILPYLVELEDINYPNIPKPIKFDRVDKTNLVAQLHKWSPRMDRRTQERVGAAVRLPG